MRFKKALGLILMSATSMSLMACSDFINGPKQKPEVLEFSNQRLTCLKTMPQNLKNFSVGRAADKDIRDTFNCASDALIYFRDKTYGSVPNAYTVDEMRNFFGKYFLKENNVSPEFAGELMKIKKALIGGNEKYLTKDEITRLVDLVGIVRDEAVQLSPHMRVLMNQSSDKSTTWEQVSDATEQLRFTLQRLLEKTNLSSSDYTFEDGKRALSGLGDFLRGSQPFEPYDRVADYVPLVEAVKNVLLGQHAQLTKLYQWQDSLNTFINLYGLALKYRYVIQNVKFNGPNDLRQVSQFINQGLDLLENSQEMQTAGYISTENLDALIDQVAPHLNFSFTLRPETIKKIYRVVVWRMLSPARQGDSRGLLGIDKQNLAALRREFNIWRLDQSFIDLAKYDDKTKTIAQKDLIASYDKFNAAYVIEKGISKDALEQMALKQSWQEFGHLLTAPMLVKFNEHGRIIEATKQQNIGVTWKSLTKTNLMRAVARMLMLGYAENTTGSLTEAKMSKAGLVAWYDEFSELGNDIKAFDPRTGNSGARSFLEANFFTFSGNGDDWMDDRETFEYVSLLFSAGLATSNDIAKDMRMCNVAQKDVFDYPYMEENCFKKQFRKNFAVYFDNMPNLATFMAKLNDAQFEEVYGYLKAASLSPDQRVGLIETANLRTMTTILHYVESIMVMYDTDKNQVLSLDEVYAAAPRFMSFFKSVSAVKYEFVVKEGFAYLVFNGSIPTASQIAGFQVSKIFTTHEATRKDIIRLFSTLKDQLNKAPK